jgi:pimeloyl-ACP methyl ester carboxylesterase/DNA-binding SARP family transcriptional activator
MSFAGGGPMLCLLGPAVIEGESTALALPPKALALLAYLALIGQAVDRQTLAQRLFPAAEDPRATLRWHLSRLRAAVPAAAVALSTSRDSVALAIPTDVALFRHGAERVCRGPDSLEASAVLALYRGDLLAGLAVSATADFDDWLYVEQEGLRRLFRRATVAFARWALTGPRAAEAVAPLARLVSVDPYFEDGHVLLIDAYSSLGRHDRAAAAYDRYQRTMRRELHAEPRPDVARRFESAPAPPGRCPLPNDELVPLAEVTIHVLDWPGAEPPVLGIHGSGLSGYSLTSLAERLAPDVRFVALDLRGHGFSDKPPSGYDLEHHVADVVELVAALGLRRPVLLGHSAGGTVAAFAASRIDAAGLILLEGMIGDRAFTENAAAQAAPIVESLERRFAGFDVYRAEQLAHSRRVPWSDEAERVADRWMHYDLAPLPDGTYRRRALRQAVEAEWASIVAADSLGALARLRCPVLVAQALGLWLGGRPYFTDEIVAAQLRAAPHAELFVARHSDHTTLIRDPEPGLIAAIRRFVAGRAGAPATMPRP